MPPPKYKLTYFAGRGRAEIIRIALSVAGQNFEDKRVTGEEWKELKPKVPQNMLPILEVDGRVLCQTGSILRYLAREHGLYGRDNFESSDIDKVIFTKDDLFPEVMKVMMEKDEEKKKNLKKELQETIVPKYVKLFSDILCDNKGGDGWIVGSKISIADIALFAIFSELPNMLGPEVVTSFDENTKLKKLYERVAAHPKVKAWLDKRPK